jgi:glycine/D-amino acid oxidase-like deaminating enzyme
MNPNVAMSPLPWLSQQYAALSAASNTSSFGDGSCLAPPPRTRRRVWLAPVRLEHSLRTNLFGLSWLPSIKAPQTNISNLWSSWKRNLNENSNRQTPQNNQKLRIGIVGGGIMGITVANSLANTIQQQNQQQQQQQQQLLQCDIIVYEGDTNGGGMDHFNQNQSVPSWTAATARNANTIAVGAAMHVFASHSALWNVVSDVAWSTFKSMQEKLLYSSDDDNTSKLLPRMDDFNVTPPYFAFHPWHCMGPDVSSEEREAFVRFASNFVYTTVVQGGTAASEDRGRTLVQLANASRYAFLTDMTQKFSCASNHYTEGLISVHRTPESAQHVVKECTEFGQPARTLSWDEAIQREPRLTRLPIKNPMYAVLRLHDIAANCEEYIRRLIDDSKRLGVAYETKKVTKIEYQMANSNNNNSDSSRPGSYKVTFDTGESTKVDMLVLAAGAETPLLAQHLGVGNYVPTYPLRGYSYTVVCKSPTWDHSKNMLQTAFAMDRMYVSSVKPWMARVTGFAELAGFRDSARDVPSKAPRVMTRYAKALFGDIPDTAINEEIALQCFRPMSPDDLPVVGAIPSRPGLFVHTGHGTLGWTTAFATAECVTQDIVHHMRMLSSREEGDDDESTIHKKEQAETFVLPNGTEIDRNVLSPSRFGWFS